MKHKILMAVLVLAGGLLQTVRADEAATLFNALERRLQSLKSLEIRYEAADPAALGETVNGRMVWVRPDKFYHDGPEWTFCETGGEQWRYLKEQGTLIRETVAGENNYQPERMLFDMRSSFKPAELETAAQGNRLLRLISTNVQIQGRATIEFPPQGEIPAAVEFTQLDGSTLRYRVTRWDENAQPDPALFLPPEVPADKVIDFRGAGTGR